MTVVNPDLPVPGVVDKAWRIIQNVLSSDHSFSSIWDSRIVRNLTTEQLDRVFATLLPLATASFADPATRKFFGIAVNLGATDIDVTPIINEAEIYQNSSDPIALEMLDYDQTLLLDVIVPANFEQFNRYLKLTGSALAENQILFLRKAVRKNYFRTAAEFQWLSCSRFASIPGSAYAVSFIGQAGPILWDSDEETRTIEVLEARQHMLRRPNLGL